MLRSAPLNSGSASRRQTRGFGLLGAATYAVAPTRCGSSGGDKPAADAASTETSTGTKWCIDTPPATVIWQAKPSSTVAASSYTITSSNDVPARDPQKWTCSGSQVGSPGPPHFPAMAAKRHATIGQ